jgi:hypothetical protein
MVIEAGVSSRSYIGVTNKQTDRGRQVEGRHTFACVSCCCFFFFLDDPCLGVGCRTGRFAGRQGAAGSCPSGCSPTASPAGWQGVGRAHKMDLSCDGGRRVREAKGERAPTTWAASSANVVVPVVVVQRVSAGQGG